ncbi:MAG: chromosomal replication initiator protein DnaA [Paludibacteraceae bacterium]|nr:chromosomal replication initiator protein DnaA [Paludibacteraceae bacterium]
MSSKELYGKWKACLELLREELSESVYNTWFIPIVPVSYAENKLVLQVKSYSVVDYIEDMYLKIFARAIYSVFGVGTQVDYRVLVVEGPANATATVASDRVAQEITKNELLGPTPQPSAFTQQQSSPQLPPLDSRLNPTYTFESFVMGECNKLVRSVALAAAKTPGNNSFNPLFIFGGSGVGKTHLLNAIGNQVKLLYPQKRVLYLSANEFKTQYMNAAQQGKVSDFILYYQSIDVLLIDDVQFLAGQNQQRTQEQFFHIFNHLHQSRKQIVMTSDRPPLEIKDLEDRLLTRFKWGFQGEMLRPDYLLRKDILRNKMSRDGIDLPDEVIDFIAENVRENVRDLEGVLASLLAYSTLMDSQIDLSLAERVVGNVVEIGPLEMRIEDIVDVVAQEFGFTPKQLQSSSRQQSICNARQISMYFAKKLTSNSLQEIGNFFGRTHATVLHACDSVRNALDLDPVMAQRIRKIENKLVH